MALKHEVQGGGVDPWWKSSGQHARPITAEPISCLETDSRIRREDFRVDPSKRSKVARKTFTNRSVGHRPFNEEIGCHDPSGKLPEGHCQEIKGT